MAQTSLFVFTMIVTTPLAAASSLKDGSTTMDSPACMATVLFSAPCMTLHSSVLCAGCAWQCQMSFHVRCHVKSAHLVEPCCVVSRIITQLDCLADMDAEALI